jgi:hypothetical protein
MIQKALQYLVSLKDTKVIEVGGERYSTEELHHVKKVYDPTPVVSPIKISTLTGLVDYIKGNVDKLAGPLVVHINSPISVSVYSELRDDARRHEYIECDAWTPRIRYGDFLDIENFNIMLQSCFLPNEHSAAVLKIIGNIVEENNVTTADDGVSQKVVAKAGVARVEQIELPNPVILCPFRTFAEVDQPESKFVFRMQAGPRAAIFEADGGIWRLYAMQNVKAYLSEKLDGCNVKIIS